MQNLKMSSLYTLTSLIFIYLWTFSLAVSLSYDLPLILTLLPLKLQNTKFNKEL
jgi:hypothetical protein